MRVITLVLAVMSAAALAASALLAFQAHSFIRHSVSAPGVVTRLLAGPLHAEVEVRPVGRPAFSYVESAAGRPLEAGRAVTVRFLPSDPKGSAQVAAADPYRPSLELAFTALVILLMAAASPWLLAHLPKLLASPIRP